MRRVLIATVAVLGAAVGCTNGGSPPVPSPRPSSQATDSRGDLPLWDPTAEQAIAAEAAIERYGPLLESLQSVASVSLGQTPSWPKPTAEVELLTREVERPVCALVLRGEAGTFVKPQDAKLDAMLTAAQEAFSPLGAQPPTKLYRNSGDWKVALADLPDGVRGQASYTGRAHYELAIALPPDRCPQP